MPPVRLRWEGGTLGLKPVCSRCKKRWDAGSYYWRVNKESTEVFCSSQCLKMLALENSLEYWRQQQTCARCGAWINLEANYYRDLSSNYNFCSQKCAPFWARAITFDDEDTEDEVEQSDGSEPDNDACHRCGASPQKMYALYLNQSTGPFFCSATCLEAEKKDRPWVFDWECAYCDRSCSLNRDAVTFPGDEICGPFFCSHFCLNKALQQS